MSLRTAILAAAIAVAAAPALGKAPEPRGYLDPATAPATLAVLSPPPAPGSLRDQADRDAFRATRALQGGPRWALAQRDVDVTAILADFACALGVRLDAAAAPRLDLLVRRTRLDMIRAVNAPKDAWRRARPYQLHGGAICTPETAALKDSFDYPSGHATLGWSTGLILAELAPDRAAPVLVRARAFGESRVVCGVHSPSAVEAGRTNASAVVAALHGSPVFRADLETARRELARLRRNGQAPDPAACASEAALTGPLAY